MESVLKKYNLKDEDIELIKIYIEELKRWNKKINLVSRNDQKWILEDLIEPVIIIKDWIDNGNVVEIGAGSGVVSIVLNIIKKDIKFTLIERREKKCVFLRYIRNKLNLNFEVLCKDVKERDFLSVYDYLILRGVKVERWHLNIARKIIYFGNVKDFKVIDSRTHKNIRINLLEGIN